MSVYTEGSYLLDEIYYFFTEGVTHFIVHVSSVDKVLFPYSIVSLKHNGYLFVYLKYF